MVVIETNSVYVRRYSVRNASVAAWARAVQGVAAAATPARRAAVRIAERNVLNNIPELQDMAARMQPQQTPGTPSYP
jgi:hypothetical protein